MSSYDLTAFCEDARTILRDRDDHDGREQVRQQLERLLRDPAFCAEHLGSDEPAGTRQLFEDPELGFCVLTYSMSSARSSPPHDHGESWAVYGQAAGYTDMTLWSDEGGRIERERTFRLQPGQAGLFDVGEIHSIEYVDGAKFVRVTGTDLSRQPRRVFDPDTGTMAEAERVATRPVR